MPMHFIYVSVDIFGVSPSESELALCFWKISVKLIFAELVFTSGQMVTAGNGTIHTGVAFVDRLIITGVPSHLRYESRIIRPLKQTAIANIMIQKSLCDKKARRKRMVYFEMTRKHYYHPMTRTFRSNDAFAHKNISDLEWSNRWKILEVKRDKSIQWMNEQWGKINRAQ